MPEEKNGSEEQATEQAQGGGGGQNGLISELMNSFRESAGETLKPVIEDATKNLAETAMQKGPELLKEKLGPKIEEAGGPAKLAMSALGGGGDMMGQVKEKIPGLGGGDEEGGDDKKPEGHGRGRRLPVQEHVDVAVNIEVAYDQFTQFEEFPNFMHRVEKIEQRDDETLMWHENIWGVRRSWEAEIVEQFPCERIVWRSDSPQTVGVVTFHKLSDNLTRVYVNLDFQPQGLFEKTASGFRISRRALKSDLKRFKAYIEMQNEPSGTWRGVIEGGEVSEEPEEHEEKQQQEEDPGAQEEEQPSAEEEEEGAEEEEEEEEEDEEEPSAEEEPDEEEEEEEEPEAEEEEEPEAEEEPEEEAQADEEEEEEKPKRSSRTRSKAASKSSTAKSKASSAKSSSSKAKQKPASKSKSRSGSRAKAGSRS
jgi:uncharacterized membrane protein